MGSKYTVCFDKHNEKLSSVENCSLQVICCNTPQVFNVTFLLKATALTVKCVKQKQHYCTSCSVSQFALYPVQAEICTAYTFFGITGNDTFLILDGEKSSQIYTFLQQ